MQKLNDWEQRLTNWAVARVGKPFVWGETDCAVLCAEAFDAMTGSTFAPDLRGRYSTVKEALRYQRSVVNLWRGLQDAGCFPVGSPLVAQAGDFLIGWKNGFFCGHVCLGEPVLSSEPDACVNLSAMASLVFAPGLRVLRVP